MGGPRGKKFGNPCANISSYKPPQEGPVSGYASVKNITGEVKVIKLPHCYVELLTWFSLNIQLDFRSEVAVLAIEFLVQNV